MQPTRFETSVGSSKNSDRNERRRVAREVDVELPVPPVALGPLEAGRLPHEPVVLRRVEAAEVRSAR